MKFIAPAFSLIFGVALLSACVTPVSTILEVPKEQRDNLNFGQTDVKFDPKLKENASLDRPKLVAALEKNIAAMAAKRPAPKMDGDVTPARVEVEVLAYKEPNAALAIVLGDNSELTGYVRVYDSRASKQIGEYYVQVIEGAGGLLGLATADVGEDGLAREFAETFFKQFESGAKPVKK